MKKNLLVLTSILGSVVAAQAQTGVHFGAKIGLSYAVLDGTINRGAEFKPSFHVGGVMRWQHSARVAIQPEIVFSQQGCNTNNYVSSDALEGKITLSYLNLPVLVKVYLGNVVNLQLGPQFGLLLAARDKGETIQITGGPNRYIYVTEDVDVKDEYKNDFGVCAGVGADLKNGLTLAARFNYGLSNIDNNAFTQQIREQEDLGGLHNRVLEVSVGYIFGAK